MTEFFNTIVYIVPVCFCIGLVIRAVADKIW